MSANLEVRFEWEHSGLMVFTQRVTKENAADQGNEKYPSWPWADIVQSFGFFQDVITLVLNEVEERFVEQRLVRAQLGKPGGTVFGFPELIDHFLDAHLVV